MAMPGTETIRFRRPTNVAGPKPTEEKDQFGNLAPQGWKKRHQGLLQDQVGRHRNGPVIPSLSFAFRLLLLVRFTGAMYAIISDCDEVFNFWEPLHYFQHNSGWQTWETSPQFAVRSWAYIVAHWPLAFLGPKILGLGERQQFFALRIALAAISSFAEAKFYRTVVTEVNERVGRYMLFMMLFSAGMWNAATAFIPSSFVMYTTMLAASYWFHPATSTPTGKYRAFMATFFTALGAILGWPFAAALGLPFVFEYLLVAGGEIVAPVNRLNWGSNRMNTLVRAVLWSACIAIPVALFDSWAYGRNTFPTLNIILYNLFSDGGPDLYGTEPWYWYIANLFVNFNFLTFAALAAIPSLLVTYKYDFRRLGKTQMLPKEGESSPYTLLTIRLAPFYLWFIFMSLQPHKEERFMFPIYPFLCFNAAVTIYLVKGWQEVIFIRVTNSPYRASQTTMFSNFALAAVLLPSFISIGRIAASLKFYQAPFNVAYHFQYTTIPNILSDLGYEPLPAREGKDGEEVTPEWDFTPLTTMKEPINLCYGTEWHRFPSSFLVPEGVNTQWIQTAGEGMMPRHWNPSGPAGKWPREETRVVHFGRFNDKNEPSAEAGAYLPVDKCHYLIALSLPSQSFSEKEPDYVHDDEHWTREYCTTFLDAASSSPVSRFLWLPWGVGERGRVYGEYCLLRQKGVAINTDGLGAIV